MSESLLINKSLDVATSNDDSVNGYIKNTVKGQYKIDKGNDIGL